MENYINNYVKQWNKAKRLLSTAHCEILKAYEKTNYTGVETVHYNNTFIFVYFGDGAKKVFKR
jgi:hypothetical protein